MTTGCLLYKLEISPMKITQEKKIKQAVSLQFFSSSHLSFLYIMNEILHFDVNLRG